MPLWLGSTDSKEIDPYDADIQNITGSLTRKQANAVLRRIDTLNASTKRQALAMLGNAQAYKSSYPADVRTIFPTQTSGQPSNSGHSGQTAHGNRDGLNARPSLNRRAFSEGLQKLQKQKSCEEDLNSVASPSSLVDVKDERSQLQIPQQSFDRRGSDDIKLQAG